MSSSFPFVPRVVSKAKRKLPHDASERQQTSTPATSSHHQSAALPLSFSRSTNPVEHEHERTKQFSNQDYIILFSLALSDYALWSDSDLRRKLNLEWSIDSSSEIGFIPLSYLFKHSKILAPLDLERFQLPIVKALRSEAADVFEVRLLITDPSPSSWLGEQQNDAGVYEIRRKDWNVLKPKELTKADWDIRTIYVERVPARCRTIPAIARFISALLAQRTSSIPIQGVILLPHHLDKPGDAPSCKGFALVVLHDREDGEFLLKRWDWDKQRNPVAHSAASDNSGEEVRTIEEREADQFGFRSLSKLRWEQLKKEYLACRSRLVSEINAYEDANRYSIWEHVASQTAQEPTVLSVDEDEEADKGEEIVVAPPVVDHSSPYPFNCLVFIRRIHPETNKTTLRKLFGAAFLTPNANGETNSDGIDYVDFNKGLDSCHVRLTTQHHAHALVRHFREHPTLQTSGLDEAGMAVTDDSKPSTASSIAAEVVTGKREELYWQKVPEKVRRQAVQKAIASMELSLPLQPSGDLKTGHGGIANRHLGAKRRKG